MAFSVDSTLAAATNSCGLAPGGSAAVVAVSGYVQSSARRAARAVETPRSFPASSFI